MEEKEQQKLHPSVPDNIDRLAADLDRFTYDCDTYGYWDTVDDTKENISQIASEILQKQTASLKCYLQEIISECRCRDCVKEAKALLQRLNALEQKKIPTS